MSAGAHGSASSAARVGRRDEVALGAQPAHRQARLVERLQRELHDARASPLLRVDLEQLPEKRRAPSR